MLPGAGAGDACGGGAAAWAPGAAVCGPGAAVGGAAFCGPGAAVGGAAFCGPGAACLRCHSAWAVFQQFAASSTGGLRLKNSTTRSASLTSESTIQRVCGSVRRASTHAQTTKKVRLDLSTFAARARCTDEGIGLTGSLWTDAGGAFPLVLGLILPALMYSSSTSSFSANQSGSMPRLWPDDGCDITLALDHVDPSEPSLLGAALLVSVAGAGLQHGGDPLALGIGQRRPVRNEFGDVLFKPGGGEITPGRDQHRVIRCAVAGECGVSGARSGQRTGLGTSF